MILNSVSGISGEDHTYSSGMMRRHRMRAWMFNRLGAYERAQIEMSNYLALQYGFPNNNLSFGELKSLRCKCSQHRWAKTRHYLKLLSKEF
jgi:hypothetical protein